MQPSVSYKAGPGNAFSLAVLPDFAVGSFIGALHIERWLAAAFAGSLIGVRLRARLGLRG